MIAPKTLILGYGLTGQSYQRYCQRHHIQHAVFDDRFKPPPKQAIVYFRNSQTCPLDEFEQLMVSPGISNEHPLIRRAKQLGITITNELDLFYQQASGILVAITGSNAKSSVTDWLSKLLQAHHLPAIACGNIGLPVLDALDTVQQAAIKNPIWIIELSSFQIERMREFKPHLACLTNVSSDHLDRHKDQQTYQAIKLSLLQTAKYCCYLLQDRGWIKPNLPTSRKQICIHPNPAKGADFFINASHQLCSQAGIICSSQDLYSQAKHNQINALFVAALATEIGLNREQISQTIGHWQGLPHRFQTLSSNDGITWINDSKATNISATRTALESSQKLLQQAAQLHLILGGDSKRDDFSTIAADIASGVSHLYLFGQDAPTIKQQLLSQFHQLQAKSTPKIHQHQTLDETITHCKQLACLGDLVLFAPACASFDQFKDYQQRGEKFAQLATASLASNHNHHTQPVLKKQPNHEPG